MNKKILAFMLAVACVAGLGLVAAGPIMKEAYSTLPAAPQAIRGGGALSGADSLTWTAPLDATDTALSVFPTRGNPTVNVSSRFSVSGATSTIQVGLFHKNQTTDAYVFAGIAGIQTATSGTNLDTNGEYIATTLYFETGGVPFYEIRKTAPSSGTIRLWTWSHGADSRRSE